MGTKINFILDMEVGFADEEYANKLTQLFTDKFTANTPQRVSWELLNEICFFDAQQYYVTGVNFLTPLDANEDKEIVIKIKA